MPGQRKEVERETGSGSLARRLFQKKASRLNQGWPEHWCQSLGKLGMESPLPAGAGREESEWRGGRQGEWHGMWVLQGGPLSPCSLVKAMGNRRDYSRLGVRSQGSKSLHYVGLTE